MDADLESAIVVRSSRHVCEVEIQVRGGALEVDVVEAQFSIRHDDAELQGQLEFSLEQASDFYWLLVDSITISELPNLSPEIRWLIPDEGRLAFPAQPQDVDCSDNRIGGTTADYISDI